VGSATDDAVGLARTLLATGNYPVLSPSLESEWQRTAAGISGAVS
jgi:hypothetical protein